MSQTTFSPNTTAKSAEVNANFLELYNAAYQGWIAFVDTLSYSSVSGIVATVSVTGDYTDRIAKGMFIRLVQGGTTKYFQVCSTATYSNPSTTFNITGGTDYTLANSAISSAYMARSRPAGFPDDFLYSYTPTGYSANPTGASRFSLNGRWAMVVIYESADGTSNTTSKGYGLPLAAVCSGLSLITLQTITVKDSGTRAFGKHITGNGSSTCTCYPTATSPTWTASGASNTCGDGVNYTYPY